MFLKTTIWLNQWEHKPYSSSLTFLSGEMKASSQFDRNYCQVFFFFSYYSRFPCYSPCFFSNADVVSCKKKKKCATLMPGSWEEHEYSDKYMCEISWTVICTLEKARSSKHCRQGVQFHIIHARLAF